MDLLFTRSPEKGIFNALKLDSDLKTVCSKVSAVTIAHHCDPYAIFVHCFELPTDEEREAIRMVVETHVAE